MKSSLLMVTLCLVYSSAEAGSSCARSPDIIKIEQGCTKDHVTTFERIEQRATSLLTSAKKRLGIVTPENVEVEESKSAKKCEYYHCVLKKLAVINEHNLPDLSLTITTIQRFKNNLDPSKCFDDLSNMLGVNHNDNDRNNEMFTAQINSDEEEVFVNGAGLTVLTHDNNPIVVQEEVACELSAALVKCLSKQAEDACSIFQYP